VQAARAAPAAPRHTLVDDIQAFGSATLLIALGLHLLDAPGLLMGGVPGMAFLLRHATGAALGACLFVVNVPFMLLGWRVLGLRFTAKTLLAMSLLSIGVELVRRHLVVTSIHPALAAAAGGLLVGVGLLVLLRHQASLGGVGVLALWLQRRLGWNVGAVQLAVDGLILGSAALTVDGSRLAWSVLAALAANSVLLLNHRPGRYAVTPPPRC
jgi:uncharacterized membrane-anchored protein YitT (DUF2179 family)